MKLAKWIWAHGEDHVDEYVHFYDRFSFDGSSVMMDISCDGNYELYVNGALAGFGQYSDYPYHKCFDRLDLTELCHKGDNTVSLLVWYHGEDTYTYYKGLPGVIYEIRDDERVLCASDRTTLCRCSEDYQSGRQRWITNQMGFSYVYDGRGYNGWKERDFEPVGYLPALEVGGRSEELYPRPVHHLSVRDLKTAVRVDQRKHIYDLGEETVGFLSICFRSEKGAVVTVSYGEHLVDLEDGTVEVPRIIGSRDFSVELISNGEWMDFSNYMRRLGCRFLQVEADGEIEIERIGLIPVEYPLNVLPFHADNPLRQRIYDTSVRTLRMCMFEHYEDCPWREQSLYHLDSRNQMLCGYYAFEEYDFPRASLELFCLDRSDVGVLHICAPSRKELYIPFFSLMFFIQMEEYARFSGDVSLIREYYQKLKDLLELFLAREEEGLLTNFYNDAQMWNFYEWNQTLSGCLRRAEERSFPLVLNGAVCMVLEKMAWIAEQVGEPSDRERYLTKLYQLRREIHRAFYCEERGMYCTTLGVDSYSQLANSMAILGGIAKAGGVEDRICAELIGSDLIEATLSMKAFLYDALIAVNEEKYGAWVLCDIDRNYGHMLDCGATSFWETIKGAADFKNAGSLCHGWSAIPVIYYHRLLKKDDSV